MDTNNANAPVCPYCAEPVIFKEEGSYFVFRGEFYHFGCFIDRAPGILCEQFGAEYHVNEWE